MGLKARLKDLFRKVKEWYQKDSEEKKEEEEFDRYIAKFHDRMYKIPIAQTALTHEGRAQIAIMIENAYTQKKISEATTTMGRATLILAIATVALVITAAYGAQGLETAIGETGKVIAVLLFLVAVLWILGVLGKMFRGLIKMFSRDKH